MSKKMEKTLQLLPRIRSKTTYGDFAKKLHTVPMAAAQLVKWAVKSNPRLRKNSKFIKHAA